MSDELRELYQEIIIDHGRRPRNFYAMSHSTAKKEGFNPLCGDRLTIFIQKENQQITEMSFQGSGCAISMASASLMIECLKGKSFSEAQQLFQQFHAMLTKKDHADAPAMGKLHVLQGVAEYPARVKCATLAWHTMMAALENNPNPISTE